MKFFIFLISLFFSSFSQKASAAGHKHNSSLSEAPVFPDKTSFAGHNRPLSLPEAPIFPEKDSFAGHNRPLSLPEAPVFPKKASSKGGYRRLLAQNNSAFDPFIDYGEFQDNVTEEENIIFFQSGRALNVSAFGGYEAVIWNIARIYGDAPVVAGIAISFFFDLHFAFQISGFFPYGHYNSLFGKTAQFTRFGIDMKYYLNKQYNNKEKAFFNPYVSFGPFWIRIQNPVPTKPPTPNIQVFNTPTANQEASPGNLPAQNQRPSNLERAAVQPHDGFGAKIAIGFEIPLIKQTFIGAEISYLYANLQFEAQDLSEQAFPPPRQSPKQNFFLRRQFPERPGVVGFRFYGDLASLVILCGVNF